MNVHEISEVLDRIAPHGPQPTGWANLARKRSIRRRVATGVAAVVVAGVLVVPVIGQLTDSRIPTVMSTPTSLPTIDDASPLQEPPKQCKEFNGLPSAHLVGLDEVIGGYYCWQPTSNEGDWIMGGVPPEDLSFLSAMQAQSTIGVEADVVSQKGHLWLINSRGDGTSVVEDVDGRFWWRHIDGTLMVWQPNGSSAAEIEGTITLQRTINSAFAESLKACWQTTSASTKQFADASSGVLCDPTGTTLEEAEQRLQPELVKQIVEQASSTWAPVSNDDRRGSGRSVILLDKDGAAFRLNQLTDGSMTWQQPDGSGLQWTPTGRVAEALTDLGMKYLKP